MGNRSADARERVRGIFEKVVADGLRRESVAGASEEQIDAAAAAQGVDRLPEAVREVLRRVGARPGRWLAGSAFGIRLDGARAKRCARAVAGGALADPGGMFVLVEHQAYEYHVIDGADLGDDDPPVWLVIEGEEARRAWGSVTGWFAAVSPDVARYRSRLRLMMEQRARRGRTDVPAWAHDLRADDEPDAGPDAGPDVG
ncbi:hypothetical protein [Actinomadura kijaniata]|uniref:hypothetical protein n=1 Tax=Actinomadura kijaniata TaxID=46161 RepID=UPI0008313C77|nr:hypothetical protein [Actinomadura kijaniata]